ncbi:HEL170Wp [Eremothecium sinecaudum]|uniref:HEL170Wp n=1 Tax=Eremothecium sinecaudum TaxID=45286 RepID=A0A0X8HTD7_9SACH|nr:HEL170Wp [Eremothecium sinecaudum]AMD21111.1 HEL170Wp [Eremothecium sinecaudum]
MSDHKVVRLIEWLLQSETVYISDKIDITHEESSGRGVILKSGELKKNEVIISIPSNLQLNFHTILHHLSKFNSNIKVAGVTPNADEKERNISLDDPRIQAYGILETSELLKLSSFQLVNLYLLAEWFLLPYLSSNHKSYWEPFFDILPSSDDLRCIPAYYNCLPDSPNKILLPYLPRSSLLHMEKISDLVRSDWSVISRYLRRWNEQFNDHDIPSIEVQFEKFLHIYFVINSRCLYTEIPLKGNAVDNFTMVPYVDFLNHTTIVDEHCYPQVVTTKRNISVVDQFNIRTGKHEYRDEGDEILLNYGAHSNDFLLNEYGFTVPCNGWNYIDVTDLVQKMITKEEHVSFLKDKGYWGEYSIASEEISFRLLVVLALISTNDVARVTKYMMGYITDEYFAPKYSHLLRQMLENMKKSYEHIILEISNLHEADGLCAQNIVQLYQGYLSIIDTHLCRL